MNRYTSKDLVRIARRENNRKRSYLFVNPLQAKHVPVSPVASLAMMKELAAQIRVDTTNAVVVGFAETATAIGAVVAASMGGNTQYIHTTRENLPVNSTALGFLEEHSHAVDQTLCNTSLKRLMHRAGELVFVDDEYSTGRTFLNALSAFSKAGLLASAPHVTALSVINWLDGERLSELSKLGIETKCLLHLDPEAYIDMHVGAKALHANRPALMSPSINELNFAGCLDDPRMGVDAKKYWSSCVCFAREVIAALPRDWCHANASVLVLGTEECMAPALALGGELESSCHLLRVKCHATTRSPISISDVPGYPIYNGMLLRSLYDSERDTYIYNLQAYDFVLVVTDAGKESRGPGVEDLTAALFEYGCNEVLVVALR